MSDNKDPSFARLFVKEFFINPVFSLFYGFGAIPASNDYRMWWFEWDMNRRFNAKDDVRDMIIDERMKQKGITDPKDLPDSDYPTTAEVFGHPWWDSLVYVNQKPATNKNTSSVVMGISRFLEKF